MVVVTGNENKVSPIDNDLLDITKLRHWRIWKLKLIDARLYFVSIFVELLTGLVLVIESIERFDAPKTAITTLLAGVVAGGVASLIFPFNPYSQISAIAPQTTFMDQLKLFLFLAVVISVFGKIYSMFTLWCKDFFTQLKRPPYMKMLYLLIIAYTISLTEIDLTGGGEQFLIMQAIHGYHPVLWIVAMMLIHLIFTSLSLSPPDCREGISSLH